MPQPAFHAIQHGCLDGSLLWITIQTSQIKPTTLSHYPVQNTTYRVIDMLVAHKFNSEYALRAARPGNPVPVSSGTYPLARPLGDMNNTNVRGLRTNTWPDNPYGSF
jgi:hypothetical protein